MSHLSPQLIRINKLLAYIHQNIEQSMSVHDLAAQSCWSRWQLQRVFQELTAKNLAKYVREQKLSRAAEQLLDGNARVTDIALQYGFSSEVSFSRAFKQHFGLAPGAYKRRGERLGISAPMVLMDNYRTKTQRMIEVRIESRPALKVWGIAGTIDNLYTPQADFKLKVPALWQCFHQFHPEQREGLTGVVDTLNIHSSGKLNYLAGSQDLKQPNQQLQCWQVPEQLYAIVSHQGVIQDLAATIDWFIHQWLPESQYQGVDGYELERYPSNYLPQSPSATMEYFLPIQKR
ncbi:AraC family transcriptional regulator [Agarivorans aestuarii]|uniref:AraC family transcriptional regulator n=1 Tax=Agarivorans aestuarii TaxID=1563703 RepID=A0ABU7G159_9ALTE|nr:AraC family transcriptional regulator [Agarivorans aestuarii]MEE1672995.1 AraC family transcriptional regulator [Agarivorans aestuarii]